jgi:hypothetical protein
MVEWFAWFQVVVAGLAGLLAFIAAGARRTPNDYTLGALLLVGILLLIQIGISIVAPFLGNTPSGDALEYWMYVITAVLMVPAALVWAIVERSVVSNVVLGVVAVSVSVMVARMHQIWFVQIA